MSCWKLNFILWFEKGRITGACSMGQTLRERSSSTLSYILSRFTFFCGYASTSVVLCKLINVWDFIKMHIGALAWLTVLASMEGEKPEANMTFIALQVQIGAVVVVQGISYWNVFYELTLKDVSQNLFEGGSNILRLWSLSFRNQFLKN